VSTAYHRNVAITWRRVGCVDVAHDVRSAVSSACRATGVRVLQEAVLAIQLHLVVSFRPDTLLSDFVRLAKSVAAVRANRRVCGAVRWARGYYVATIHKRDLTRVSRLCRAPVPAPSGLGPTEVKNGCNAQLTPGASPGSTQTQHRDRYEFDTDETHALSAPLPSDA
jgi:REP element-mobilizing transposase RayT